MANFSGWIKDITIPPPSLQDNTGDADRIIDFLKHELDVDTVDIDMGLLKTLPAIIRKSNYSVRTILVKDGSRWLITGIMPKDEAGIAAGLAVDLGTTMIVIRIIDLLTGNTMGETSFLNPQRVIGPDILTRLHFADQNGGLEQLNRLIIDDLNQNIKKLSLSCGITENDIYLVSAAGNTAMTHLFLDLDPHWIIREPYIPVINRPNFLKASDIGLMTNLFSRVFVFPNIGSYFGGDLIAGILFSGLNKIEETAILVDVGTNAEVVLGNKSWLMACAGAAGPALEGGVTKMGMMAGPGVIDKVHPDPSTHGIKLHTIEGKAPIGICGSGLIDLAAYFFLSNVIDMRGKFIPSQCNGRLTKIDGIDHFIVVSADEAIGREALTISQVDMDSLIRSKAAMFTILETITTHVGVPLNNLSKFYVAGTFGSFINPESAIAIGMLPDLPVERYKALGNSSLGGATMALLSSDSIAEIDRIRNSITYMELNVNQEFMNRFSAAKFIPHTDPLRFPSVKIPDH